MFGYKLGTVHNIILTVALYLAFQSFDIKKTTTACCKITDAPPSSVYENKKKFERIMIENQTKNVKLRFEDMIDYQIVKAGDHLCFNLQDNPKNDGIILPNKQIKHESFVISQYQWGKRMTKNETYNFLTTPTYHRESQLTLVQLWENFLE